MDAYGVAVAKALAPPPVAAEWCLPLVRPGGAAILWVGPSRRRRRASPRVAARLGGGAGRGARRPARAAEARADAGRAFRAAPEWPGNVRWPEYPRRRNAGEDLRAREPEGRGRQDDDRRQPRGLPGRGRRARARRRPRPAGERDLGARRAGERGLERRPARRRAARHAHARDRFAKLDLVPSKADLAGTAADLARREHAEHYLAEGAGGRDRRATPSSSSTARPRSGR